VLPRNPGAQIAEHVPLQGCGRDVGWAVDPLASPELERPAEGSARSDAMVRSLSIRYLEPFTKSNRSTAMNADRRRRVALVGATGVAGQQFLVSLANHPWFELTTLAASPRSAGKKYTDAIATPGGSVQWGCEEPLPGRFADQVIVDAAELDLENVDLVFTAVESDAAKGLEQRFAAHVPVVSTASAFRYEDDVPILLPGVNVDHVALVKRQQQDRGWKGFVVPIPNCTTTGLAMALAPLARQFGVSQVVATSLQALSGAGRSPGVLGLDILDNVVPYVPGEEEKVQKETAKILGRLEGDEIVALDITVSATCTRVQVRDGHTVCASVSLGQPASIDEVKAAFRGFGSEFCDLGLPSAPAELIYVTDDPFHPQPKADRGRGDGMTTTIGRVREDTVLPNGVKFVLLSHNTKMGAAKGAVLTAEILIEQGLA
jgi:aspartate-semialdehyde dehydrogenase